MTPAKITAANEMNRSEFNDREVDTLIRRARPAIRRAMRRLKRPEARVGVIASPLGRLLVTEGPRGIANVHFLWSKSADRPLEMLRHRFDLIENENWRAALERELGRYFHGDCSVLDRRVDLTLVESEFQRRALGHLRSIPNGAVTTYQGLAAALGYPDAQRAIGNTMASNPVPLFVPCHRVIRSDGTIGNYGGGVDRKLMLLRGEGFRLKRDLKVPAEAVLGHRKTRIYCRPQCSAARRANPVNALIFADPAHARGAGLRACKLCNPG